MLKINNVKWMACKWKWWGKERILLGRKVKACGDNGEMSKKAAKMPPGRWTRKTNGDRRMGANQEPFPVCHKGTTDQKPSHLLPALSPLPISRWDGQILNGDLNSQIVHPHAPKLHYNLPPEIIDSFLAQNHKEPPDHKSNLRRASAKWWRTGETGKRLIAKWCHPPAFVDQLDKG